MQAAGTGDDGQMILERAPVSAGNEAQVTEAGDYRFFAGWRSDPFFFDTQCALNNLQFTGVDFFAEADVCSIVLEVTNRINEDAHAINFNQAGGVTEPGNAQAGLWACRINSWIGVKRPRHMPGRPRCCSEKETRAHFEHE
jgi:hypothetical protein